MAKKEATPKATSNKTDTVSKVTQKAQPVAKAKPPVATKTQPVAQPTAPKEPELKKVVFNGITYGMSDQDYDLFTANQAKLQAANAEIQTILSRSHVLSAKDALLKGELTPKAMECLVGHSNIMYIMADGSGYKFNTDKYNGYKIDEYEDGLIEYLTDFAQNMRTLPGFTMQYTIESVVVMTTAAGSRPKDGSPIKNPKYSKTGTMTVGNIVVRDNKSGKLELYGGETWFVASSHPSDAQGAAEYMMTDFLDLLGMNAYDICSAFARAHNEKPR